MFNHLLGSSSERMQKVPLKSTHKFQFDLKVFVGDRSSTKIETRSSQITLWGWGVGGMCPMGQLTNQHWRLNDGRFALFNIAK